MVRNPKPTKEEDKKIKKELKALKKLYKTLINGGK
jgi:hypothetical protein